MLCFLIKREIKRRNGTNSNSSGKASDWGTDKLRSDNNGKCRTERTVREIRSRFDEISNIDKRYNVSERAKELSVQQRDAEKLTGKNEPVRDEQSDNKQDNTSREKVYREMENLVKRQIERYCVRLIMQFKNIRIKLHGTSKPHRPVIGNTGFSDSKSIMPFGVI